MIPSCSKFQTTYNIILVTAIDVQQKPEKMLFADGSKILHSVILFSDFLRQKVVLKNKCFLNI